MTGKLVNFRHVPVGFGLLGSQSGRLFEIVKGIGIPPGVLVLLSEFESSVVKQVYRY
jgi:hypothetical protein